jgi:hypothetical protein
MHVLPVAVAVAVILPRNREFVKQGQRLHQRVAFGSFCAASAPIFCPMALPTTVELR